MAPTDQRIALGVNLVPAPASVLGRHEVGSTEHRSDGGECRNLGRMPNPAGDPEVQHLEPHRRPGTKQVRWLDVAMHDAAIVSHTENVEQPIDDFQRIRGAQTAPRQARAAVNAEPVE